MATSRVAVFLMVCLAGADLATAGVTIDVYPSSAPNGYGSPSWGGYCVNALNSLENGLGNVGDRSTSPTAYEIAPAVVGPGEIAVTSFKSWRGQVNPSAPFANEYGNRMHFGLHAYGDGTAQFRLADLTFELHSSDPWDSLVFVGNFIGYSYNGTTRYGINWGLDRVKGGGDDIKYTSGNGTTLVDEIVYVGVGNAWWPGGDDPNPSNPAGGAQAAMNEYFVFVAENDPITVSCEYTILTYTGDASVDVVAPSPACNTLAAEQIKESSAVLKGEVVEDNGFPCEYRFVYWPDGGTPLATDWTGPVQEGATPSVSVNDLIIGKRYHYRMEVRNDLGEGLGNVRDFATMARLTISSGPHGSVTNPGVGVFLYDYGQLVRLEAEAQPGYVFAHWSGSYFDSRSPTYFEATRDHHIQANFVSALDTIYVAARTPGDPEENGTPEHPFDSIQEAIDVAGVGVEILVNEGLYRERVDLTGKTVVLRGLWLSDPNRPGVPVLDGNGDGPVVTFGKDANSVLSGFCIQGGQANTGAAVLCTKARATLRNCLLVGNQVDQADGGAIDCQESEVVLDNCTISGNTGVPGALVLAGSGGQVAVSNAIVWGNTPLALTNLSEPVFTVAYSDVEGSWPGTGNLDADPLFAAPGADYHLQSQTGRWDPLTGTWLTDAASSPCLDAGDPAGDYSLEPLPNGGRLNLGAYGGTTQASQSP